MDAEWLLGDRVVDTPPQTADWLGSGQSRTRTSCRVLGLATQPMWALELRQRRKATLGTELSPPALIAPPAHLTAGNHPIKVIHVLGQLMKTM